MTDNKLKKPAKINAYLKLVAGKKKLVGNGCLLFYLEKKVGMSVRTSVFKNLISKYSCQQKNECGI